MSTDFIFRGYLTHNPEDAARLFVKKTGSSPTILLIRPEFQLIKEHPLVVRSIFGAAGAILVSDTVEEKQIREKEFVKQERESTISARRNYRTKISSPDDDENGSKKIKIYKTTGKKKINNNNNNHSECPLCHSEIIDFETLGVWWGWSQNIVPPYWNKLVSYIYQRDDYTCRICKKKIKVKFLVAHHIMPKEQGGSDSAKNLMTVCVMCHQDNKPIFADDETIYENIGIADS